MSKKTFTYATGKEKDTDDFISSTLNAAPKVEAMEMSTGNFARDGSYYAVNTGGEKRYSNRCSRIVVMVWAAVLVVIGLALAIVGGVEKSKGLLPICPNCSQVVIMLIAIGVVIIVFGIVGAYASYTRNACIAGIFGIVLALLCLLFLGCGIGVAVINSGTHLDEFWKWNVKNDPDAICKVQEKLQCSGYTACCYYVGATNSSTNSNTTAAAVVTTTAAAPPAPVPVPTPPPAPPATAAPTAAPTDAPTPAPPTPAPPTPAPPTPAPPTPAPPPLVKLRFGMMLADGDATTTTVAAAAVSGCTAIVPGSQAEKDLAEWCVRSCTPNAPPCEPTLKSDFKSLLVPALVLFFALSVCNGLVAWGSYRMLKMES